MGEYLNVIDLNEIVIIVRDINGKRIQINIRNVNDFKEYDWSWYDDENYQILFVVWGKHCIYNGLINEKLYLEELIGFFA